jgi:hypothetical protein
MSTQPPAPIVLNTDRLSAEIAPPGTAYARTRFDWSAFITQVTLDPRRDGVGPHTYCVPEDPDPAQGTGGIGLCNEFGIETAVGYADAQPGEPFPKLGIGLLEKIDDGPYSFMRPFRIVERFPIQVETAENAAQFVVEPLACRGYAARLTKTVTVQDVTLQIAYQLENVGAKPIVTDEYVHNFLGIDGHLMGPDYRLRLPYPVRFEEPPPGMPRRMMGQVLVVDGPEISLRETPQRPFYRRLVGYAQTDRPQWELTHTPTGVGLREIDDFSPCRVALWGTTHVISAEVFCPIEVQPGETQTWRRRYEFES